MVSRVFRAYMLQPHRSKLYDCRYKTEEILFPNLILLDKQDDYIYYLEQENYFLGFVLWVLQTLQLVLDQQNNKTAWNLNRHI